MNVVTCMSKTLDDHQVIDLTSVHFDDAPTFAFSLTVLRLKIIMSYLKQELHVNNQHKHCCPFEFLLKM